jgi:hypothetical protein
MKSKTTRDGAPTPASADAPEECFAPIEWRGDELERLRVRVRELLAGGLRRSEASQVAFSELVTARAIQRAQADANQAPEPPEAA